MMGFLGNVLGKLLSTVYNIIAATGPEPERFSYYAMSIIATTVIFKLLLLPMAVKQAKSMKVMGKIQPKLLEIQEKYKDDPMVQQKKMSDLYKEYKYNPASGCLMLIVQLPILLAFFKVMQDPVTYAFKNPAMYQAMNKSFLWISNLEKPDHLIYGLPLIAAVTTYLQSVTMKTGDASEANEQMASTQKTMNIFLPIMIFMSARNFPAGLALYWVVSNGFGVIQQLVVNKIVDKED